MLPKRLLALCALAMLPATAPQAAAAQERQPYCGPAAFETMPLPRPFGPSLKTLACRAYVIVAPLATLRLAVALTPEERARGLMGVRSLPPFTGVLFAFPGGDETRSFWMKDTLIPLDMVFVAKDGRVNALFESVPSSTFDTPDRSVATRQGAASFVIELPAGDAKRAGLRAGARVGLTPLEQPPS